jgi:mannitol-1-phosphate 5-dehydrogenase
LLALQFGAGKIGRGFLAQLYARSGFETVFVETRADLVASLNRHRTCWIEWTDGVRETIAPVSAIDAQDIEAIAAAFARAEVASTAVGVNVLPQLAPLIAAGLRRRAAENPKPLNLLLGENALEAHTRLRDALLQTLAPDEHPPPTAQATAIRPIRYRVHPKRHRLARLAPPARVFARAHAADRVGQAERRQTGTLLS